MSQLDTPPESDIPFTTARRNFYGCAQHGLNTKVNWKNGKEMSAQTLILDELLPAAETGLNSLNLNSDDISKYLGIVEARVASGQTGAAWQRKFQQKHNASMTQLTQAYYANQQSAQPVHTWDC